MKYKLTVLTWFILFFVGINYAQTVTRGSDGQLFSEPNAIASAISNSGTVDGDVLTLSAGTFVSSATISVTKKLTIQGAGIGSTIIDGTTATGSISIFISVTTTNVTISNLTIDGGKTTWGQYPYYGINVSQISSSTSNAFTLTNVEVKRFGKTGINFNGAIGVTITSAYSHDNLGAGLGFSDCKNIHLTNITTSNNSWGGVGIFNWGRYYAIGTSQFVIDGTNSFSETSSANGGLYLESANWNNNTTPTIISYSTNPADNANVTIQSSDFPYVLMGNHELQYYSGTPFGNNVPYTYNYKRFYHSLTDVFNAAVGEPTHYLDDGGRYIKSTTDGQYYVSALTGTSAYKLTVQTAVSHASSGNTVNVAAGTYNEDVTINVSGLNLLGAGYGSTTISGIYNGSTSTIAVGASHVTIAGFKITRLGNNTTDWNDASGTLNLMGISIQGIALKGISIHDNLITQNRTGIDINNSSGHTVRNNVITDNRTGMILRNVTDSLTVVENEITNNWTLGIVFLDATNGNYNPSNPSYNTFQSALNCTFSDNNISGNWYGQVVDRQTGGSLPAPGANLKNFAKNWFGTNAPIVSSAASTEPAYASQIPTEFSGSATAPGTAQPTICGAASANIIYSPYLNVGTDTNVETTTGRGTYGFQGDLTQLATGNLSNTTIDNVVDSTPPGGTVNIETPGTLGHITYSGTGTVTLNNTSGGTVVISGGSPALTVSTGTLTMNGFTFTTSTNDPTILVNGTGHLTIRNCTIEASTGYSNSAIRVDDTGVVDAGASTSDPGKNTFLWTAGDVAFTNNTLVNMNAIGNWWGNASGPYQATTNPAGTGGTVTDHVNYYPWYIDSGLTTLFSISAPSLTAPADGLTGVSLIPSFSWSAVTGATSYVMYLDTTASFSSGWSYSVSGTSTSFDISTLHFPLANNKTYYWRVSSIIAGVVGSPSPTKHFITVPVVPVYIANPANGSTVYYPDAATFSWYTGQLTNNLTFILQYKYSATAPTNETFWVTATTVQTTDLYYTTALQGGRTYYWRVLIRKTTPATAPYDYVYYPSPSVYYSFTTGGGASVTVTESYPVGGTTVYSNTPTVYWYLDQYASGLTYQVAWQSTAPAGGDTNLFDNTGVVNILPTSITYTSNMYHTMPTLPAGTTIYWQVLAYYSLTGQTVLSGIGTFVTPSDPTVTPVQPNLAYPIAGVTIYSTNPTLYWYLGQSAGSGLRYQIAIKDNVAPGDDNLFDDAGITLIPSSGNYTDCVTDMFYTLSSLIPGHTYYWQVRSRYSGATWSTNSTIESFVVATGTSSYPVASWPVGNPTVYTSQPTLYWYLQGTSLGLSGYTVKWKKTDTAPSSGDWAAITTPTSTANAGSESVSPITTTYYTITTDLTYGGHYFWYVDSGNPSTATTGDFTVLGGTISDPILFQPADGSTVYSTTVTFSWFVSGSTIGIQGYELVFSPSDTFDPSVTSYYDGGSGTGHYARITSQTATVSGLTAGATYYWKVRAYYGGSTFSNWVNSTAPYWSFNIQVGSSLVQPIVGGPTNIKINTAAPMLSWVIPTKTAANSKYEVQLAENSNFSSAKTYTTTKAYYNVSGLSSSKNYYWRVRSISSDGTSSYYSNSGSFSVGDKVTAIETTEVIPTEYSLSQNYPNPFNPSTRISFALPQNVNVLLKIYDMLGREVKTLINQEMNAGNHSTFWNGDNNLGSKVSSGMYIYRLTAGEYVATKKMVLIK